MATFQLGRLLIVLLLVAITGFYSVYKKQEIETFFISNNIDSESHSLLKTMPEVVVEDYLSDKKLALKDYINTQNTGILVHIWGTWCGPCESEIPLFLNFAKKFDLTKFKVVLIAVNDEKVKVQKFFERFKDLKNFEITLDANHVAMDRFGTFKVPETYLFNSKGELLKKYIGPQEWGQVEIYDQVNLLVNKN